MKLKSKLLNAVRQCRNIVAMVAESQGKAYSAIVIACGFILAVSLCLVLRPSFEFREGSDIVSWITVSKYPKQQETFYYIASLLAVPLIAMASWAIWILCSILISHITKLPLHNTLKKYSFPYLSFILILKSIYKPTFSGMLLMPLILFAGIKIALMAYDISKTRLAGIFSAIFSKGSSDLHWSVFASGICAGIFMLIGYTDNAITLLACLRILFLWSFVIWLFWLVYSKVLSLITKRRFSEALANDVYSYFSLIILLAVSLFFEHKSVIMIISIIALVVLKALTIIKPSWFVRIGSKQAHKRILEYALIPAIIYVVFYSGGRIHGGIDMFHEGERLAPLNALLRGEIPYRDIYLQHGLFYNAYRPLLASKLFGVSLASDRLLGHLIDPLGFVAFYILALQIFKSKLSAFLLLWILSSGVSEGFVIWSPDRRMVYTPGRLAPAFMSIALLAIHFLKQHARKIHKFYLFPTLAGICSTIAMLNSLETGLYATVACLLFLLIYAATSLREVRQRCMILLSYIVGVVIAFIPVAFYFLLHGALDDLIKNSYIQCRYQNTIWGLRFPPLFPELEKLKSIESLKAFLLSYIFRWYLPALVYLIAVTYIVYQFFRDRLWKDRSSIALLLMMVCGIVFFRTMLGRSDSTHLYGMSFAWMIGMFIIETLFIKIWRDLKMDFSVPVSWHSHVPMSTCSHPMATIACRLAIILLLIWYATSVYNPVDTARRVSDTLTSYQNIKRNVESPFDRAGGIEIPADQASHIKAVVEYIRDNTKPNEAIFDFSNQGAYYFFAARPMASKYHQVCYAATEAMQKEAIDDLEKDGTKLIIFSNNAWMDSIDGITNMERHRLIAEYIKANYAESARIGPTIFMKRIDR